jgi:hypothetical protein
VCNFEQTAVERSSKISRLEACFMKMHEDAMSKIGQPAEPKHEVVECAIVELLDMAQRQGITSADFIQLLDSGMQIADFLAAMKSPEHAHDSLD